MKAICKVKREEESSLEVLEASTFRGSQDNEGHFKETNGFKEK